MPSAIRAASSTLLSGTSGWPYAMLFRTVSLNSTVSCVTLPICSRSEAIVTSRRSWPSIRIRPSFTSKNRGIRFTSEDLPAPLGPTNAITSPGCTVRLMSCRTSLRLSVALIGEAYVLKPNFFVEALQHKCALLLLHVVGRIHELEDFFARAKRLLKAVVEQLQTSAPGRTA